MADLSLTLFQRMLLTSFVALKWKRDPPCLLVEHHEIGPNMFFVCPSRHLVSCFPNGNANCLQFGMHEANKHITFAASLVKIN